MMTFLNSSFLSIQNDFIATNYLSDSAKKYAKIGAIALAVLSAVVAFICICRHYKAKPLETKDSDLPPHVFPPLNPHKKTDGDKKEVDQPPHEANLNPPSEKIPPEPESQEEPNKKTDGDKKEVDQPPHEANLKPPSEKIPPKPEGQEEPITHDEFAKKLQDQFDNEASEDYVQTHPKDDSPLPAPAPSPNNVASVVNPANQQQENIGNIPVVNDAAAPQKPKLAQPSPFEQIEKICGEIAENIFINPNFSAVKALSKVDKKIQDQVLECMNEIIEEFEKRYAIPPYRKIPYRASVPQYFSNVIGFQTEEERKYLSLAGMRNLLHCGPKIIDEFAQKRFLGGAHHYAPMEGLNAFKYYTGNVVDLDTELDQSIVDKGDSAMIKEAENLIVKFGRICGLEKPYKKLTAQAVIKHLPDRKLDLPNGINLQKIHLSYDNTDRSDYGIWKRKDPMLLNAKVKVYVNVPPNCNLVLLATYRIPYMIAELAYRTKEQNNGQLTKEFFDEFFDKGLSTKCFNDKAQTLSDFYLYWMAKLEGTPSAEEDARSKIVKGDFGEIIKNKGPKLVFEQAQNRDSLSGFLLDFGYEEIKYEMSFDKWRSAEEKNIRNILKNNHLWEEVLYQTDKESDFFMLNQSTLNVFLKDFYDYLRYI
jgi:hypothetical protein